MSRRIQQATFFQPPGHFNLFSRIEARKKGRERPGCPFLIAGETAPHILLGIDFQRRMRITIDVVIRAGAAIKSFSTFALYGITQCSVEPSRPLSEGMDCRSRAGIVPDSMIFRTTLAGILIARRPTRTTSIRRCRIQERIVGTRSPSQSATSSGRSSLSVSSLFTLTSVTGLTNCVATCAMRGYIEL
jgi:hypothetical protein